MSALLFSNLWQLLLQGDFGYHRLIATGQSMPDKLRAIQESFLSASSPNWICCLSVLTIFAMVIAAIAWQFNWSKPKAARVEDNNPEKLFDEMLGVIHLSESDKRLLRQMVSQGRLKHPAMCLLSPGMLEWTRELWVQEKGSSYVTEAKTAQIREISVKLYGHHGGGRMNNE